MYIMLRHTMESFVKLWSKTNEDKSQILYIRETGCIKPSIYCLARYYYRIAYSIEKEIHDYL